MIWLNGKWKKEEEAAVGVTDSSFLRGEGVFETMLARKGKIVELERHWQRLAKGGLKFGIQALELAEARSILRELLAYHEFEPQARVRVRVTQSRDNLLFSARESAPYPQLLRLSSTPYRRNEAGALTGIKTLSYSENSVALSEAKRKGADEIIFANGRGEWCEGAWSNVFAVENGRLLTPPLESGCLPGVTRELVLALARKEGLEVLEIARPVNMLRTVDEIFLTSSLLGVGVVGQLDDRAFEKSPMSALLARLLRDYEEASVM